MANDLSGTYEALIPVATEEGTKQPGEKVKLSHEDAETFLRREFVKKPEKKRASKQDDSEE